VADKGELGRKNTVSPCNGLDEYGPLSASALPNWLRKVPAAGKHISRTSGSLQTDAGLAQA
jgi:hypothetical protein